MTSVPAPARLRLSVIVPTHNRRASLERLLAALLSQSRSLDDVEVVVVADGCCDDTVTRLRARTDLPLTVVECPGLGPASARNAGAEAACGDILIFLDDDIVPGRNWLAAHEAAHILHPGTVVIGPYRPVPNPQEREFRRAAQLWWDQHFDELQSPGHRILYTDILTGNISVPAEIWRRLNGLDERLRAHEDYDYGLRLLSADVPIIVATGAAGLHYEHETMQIDGALRRAQQEGHADAILAEKHPSIRNDLKLVAWWRWPSRASRAKNRLIFEQGGRLQGLARWAERRLPTLECWNLLPQHRAVLRYLQSFWYIRGVAAHFDTFAEWRAFALQPDLEPEGQVLSIDLQPGLPAAEVELELGPPCLRRVALWGDGDRPLAANSGRRALGWPPPARPDTYGVWAGISPQTRRRWQAYQWIANRLRPAGRRVDAIKFVFLK